jgi:hypothetical protein
MIPGRWQMQRHECSSNIKKGKRGSWSSKRRQFPSSGKPAATLCCLSFSIFVALLLFHRRSSSEPVQPLSINQTEPRQLARGSRKNPSHPLSQILSATYHSPCPLNDTNTNTRTCVWRSEPNHHLLCLTSYPEDLSVTTCGLSHISGRRQAFARTVKC